MEEKELCSRTTYLLNKKYLRLAIAMVILGIIGIVTNIIIRISSAEAYGEHAFKLYQGPYWAGWGILIIAAALAILFFYYYFKQKKNRIVITLTNKRIKTEFLSEDIQTEDNFMLKKIVSFTKLVSHGSVRISFTTVNNKTYVYDNLDDEFYNLFISAL